MAGIENRKARFRTVIALLMNGKQHLFEGILEGTIALQTHGDEGFGYDPVFQLADGRTLAELSKEEKGEISHRGIATRKLVAFLSKNQ
jgi:XTP/dITP diphosphohydrolase